MKKIIFALVIATTMMGCTDLEEEPIGVLAPESFFNTTDDLQAAVNGSYSYIASEEFWGRKLTLSLLLRGDMVTIGDPTTSGRRIQVDLMDMDGDNGMITAFWPRSYAIIGATNNAIEGAASVEASEAVKNAIVAQARFVRAFTYYHLVRIFGEVPYIDFAVREPEVLFTVGKTSVDEIYANIIADLEYAKSWLPDQQPFRSIPSKGTAASYLASVHLTLGNWQEAYDEATFVINNKARFGYDLEADFQDLFDATKADGLVEHVFSVDFKGIDATSNLGRDFIPPLTGMRGPANEGWSVAVPTVEVYDSFDDNDYRKAVSFDTEAVFDGVLVPWQQFGTANRGVSRPHIAKYYRLPGTAGTNNRDSDHNYGAMRYAEVLLIAAEASNELSGPTGEAVDYVNQIRTRARNAAGTMNSFPEDINAGLSKDAFRDVIIEERRIELAFEFKRWYDIKRLNLGMEVFGPTSLEPQPNFDPTRDYLFPLPNDELGRNPNLLPQNPGY
ncbi:RagB/SusD family nutrient uptake outer membrane protein [Aquimarina sp. SS2-1]|uniref:RagB/SusD family nutrient uptake outer membrane protein n=1 Tax=Aquimarina besae TaxID=3342247 RepID=UPI00366F54FD